MRISDWSSDVCSSDLCYFGRRKDRLPRTALPLRLARGHQRAAPDRGRVSFEEVARRHPAYASTMLFGHRLVARDCHKSILATSARQDWRLARAPSSTGYGDLELRAAKCPSSMRDRRSTRLNYSH